MSVPQIRCLPCALKFVLTVLGVAMTQPILAHGDLHERINALSKSISINPAHAQLFLQRGELYRLHGETDLAIADYQVALRLEPTLDLAQLGIGRACLDSGKPAQARAALDIFLKKHPGNAEALLARARASAAMGEHSAAAADFCGALGAVSHPAPEIYLERAAVLAKDGCIDQAIEGLDEGIARLGHVPPLELGIVELELGRHSYDAALARLDGQIERAPRKEFLLCRRGAILEKAGRLAEARSAYDAASRAVQALPPASQATRAVAELVEQTQAALHRLSKHLGVLPTRVDLTPGAN